MDYALNFTPHIKIIPLANESMGVRGFSFLVILSPGLHLLIDPSVSLGPRRKGFVPHPYELSLSWLFRNVLLELAPNTSFIFITHYHGDHYTIPWNRKLEFTSKETHEKTYFQADNLDKISFTVKTENEDKIVSAKRAIFAISPKHVTWNQKKRARFLWEKQLPEGIALFSAENALIKINDYEIKVSKPLPHGFDRKRGNVTAISIKDLSTGKKVIFSSDLEGATNPESREYLLKENADLVFLDGAGVYHPKVTEKEITQFVDTLAFLVDNGAEVIITHHFNRTENRNAFLEEHGLPHFPSVFEKIAGFHYFLESIRKDLWETHPFEKHCCNPRKPYYYSDLEIDPFIGELFHEFPKIKQFFEYLRSVAKSYRIS